MRERVKATARYSIPFRLNDEGRKLAVQAIAEGIDRLPPGTSKDKLDAAADVAPQPFLDAIRKYAEELRRQQEQARLQEEEARQERDTEEAAARQRREAGEEQARKRSAAEACADTHADLSTIYHVVAELDRKGDLDHGSFDENWALAQRLVKRVRPMLVDVLLANPSLSEEEIKRQVERLVDRHLNVCKASDAYHVVLLAASRLNSPTRQMVGKGRSRSRPRSAKRGRSPPDASTRRHRQAPWSTSGSQHKPAVCGKNGCFANT